LVGATAAVCAGGCGIGDVDWLDGRPGALGDTVAVNLAERLDARPLGPAWCRAQGHSGGGRNDMDQEIQGGVVREAWREGPIGTARPDQRTFSEDVIAQRQSLVHTIH
jgi:hypothetical protein